MNIYEYIPRPKGGLIRWSVSQVELISKPCFAFLSHTWCSPCCQSSGQTSSLSLSCQPVPQSVLDEMMVEQTDLVRLRLVRMSNVPDTLYMVNNAVPQCCHMISHQQMASTSAAAPSVVANEIPGKEIVKQLITAVAFMLKYKQLNHPYTWLGTSWYEKKNITVSW